MWKKLWLRSERNEGGFFPVFSSTSLGILGGRSLKQSDNPICRMNSRRFESLELLLRVENSSYSMCEGDHYNRFSGLAWEKKILFQREWSCYDKWGLPLLTGDRLASLCYFRRRRTNLLLYIHFQSAMYEKWWDIYLKDIVDAVLCWGKKNIDKSEGKLLYW